MSKYISFGTHATGFVNLLMTLEVAFSLSEITGRTLIIPPNFWCLFESKEYDKTHFVDILQYFDKEYIYNNFNCIDFYDVPELSGLFSKIEKKETDTTPYSYTGNIQNHVSDLKNITFANDLQEPCRLSNSQIMLFCGNINDDLDFSNFLGLRKSLNLNFDEKFLHFEDNIFGTYWYSVYPGNSEKRNELKTKINFSFLYNQKFAKLSETVYNTVGSYDAIHVRRNDFLETRSENLSDISTASKFSSIVKYLLKEDRPLYIATDEKDLSFFDELKKYKKLYFFNDFHSNYSGLGEAIIEQLICTNAEVFYGTFPSTYSKRINILRGYQNKQAFDGMGINNLYDSILDYKNPIPWTNPNRYWDWSSSSHPQWLFE